MSKQETPDTERNLVLGSPGFIDTESGGYMTFGDYYVDDNDELQHVSNLGKIPVTKELETPYNPDDVSPFWDTSDGKELLDEIEEE